MYIIAGLGNPGTQYMGTRHNAGFSVIDALADQYNISVDTQKHKGMIGKGMIEGEKVILVKPMTYMNLSGECIREVMDYYKADIDDLIVIFDDISLEPGKLDVYKRQLRIQAYRQEIQPMDLDSLRQQLQRQEQVLMNFLKKES